MNIARKRLLRLLDHVRMHTAEKIFQCSVFEKRHLREHISSVEDQPRLDADPDPTFNFDADPGRIRIGIKTMSIRMRILSQVFYTFGKEAKICYFYS